MREIIAILGGIGIGAGLMYVLDPDRGNRRRALIRDKMVKLNRQTQETVEGRLKDAGNRAKGLLHETKSMFKPGEKSREDQPASNFI